MSSFTPTSDLSPSPASTGAIIAGPGRYYRVVRYIMAAACILMAAYFALDGFIRWPAEQQQQRQVIANGGSPAFKTHSDTDILIQKILAGALPILGLGILAWMFYRSRGQYRLEGQTLHVPGHPPVPLESIREIDKSRWDRKGIVRIQYEPSGDAGARWLTLDDFIYAQKPTDAILEQIEAAIVPDESAADTQV